LAFAVPHNVLQETIGVVIVPHPGENRISLPSLLALLASSLHPSKWPALVVYMDALPVNAAGKPLRIGLSGRFGLEEVHDGIETLARHFEARELDADQLEPGMEKHKAPIPCQRVQIDTEHTLATLKAIDGVEDATLRFRTSDGSLEAFVSTDPRNLHALDAKAIKEALARCMHDYEVPDHVHLINTPLPADASGAIDYDALLAMVALNASSAMSAHALTVRRIISTLLIVDENDISADSDFFLLGGNSLLLGRLAYFIRKETGVSLQISMLFTNSTVGAIAKMVELEDKKTSRGPSKGPTRAGSAATLKDKDGADKFSKLDSDGDSYDGPELAYGEKRKKGRGQNHPLSLFIQAIPLIFFYPMKAALTCEI
jgi:acyl carrier protein